MAYPTHRIDPATKGVAIFACWGAEEFLEAIQLTTLIGDNYVRVGNQPHLYHLVRLDEHFPGTLLCSPIRRRRESLSLSPGDEDALNGNCF